MGISCSSFQPAVNCAIVFDKANGVSALGNVLFGQLQSNPDIAGIGVSPLNHLFLTSQADR
jgi:hypothetical protein